VQQTDSSIKVAVGNGTHGVTVGCRHVMTELAACYLISLGMTAPRAITTVNFCMPTAFSVADPPRHRALCDAFAARHRSARDYVPPLAFRTGISNFSFVVPATLAGRSLPGCEQSLAEDVCEMTQYGITALVSVYESAFPQQVLDAACTEARVRPLVYLHLAVNDMCAPTLEQLDTFVGFVHEQTRNAVGAVAVHCYAGVGRTGTAIAAYMIAKHDMGCKEAIHMLRTLRPLSVQSRAQEDVLHEYAALCKSRNEQRAVDGAGGVVGALGDGGGGVVGALGDGGGRDESNGLKCLTGNVIVTAVDSN
jgi:predicted protein tyrosine phosphatase